MPFGQIIEPKGKGGLIVEIFALVSKSNLDEEGVLGRNKGPGGVNIPNCSAKSSEARIPFLFNKLD